MDLTTARRHIQSALERMRACYLKPVFDEWAILAVPATVGGILAYQGPRPDAFRARLAEDADLLCAVAAGRQFAEGDIEFVADAAVTRHDSFMKIGPTSYLILNHTMKTLSEIRADPRWLGAQAVLFELSEKFRADPLQVQTSDSVER